jgi:hypothetical protein
MTYHIPYTMTCIQPVASRLGHFGRRISASAQQMPPLECPPSQSGARGGAGPAVAHGVHQDHQPVRRVRRAAAHRAGDLRHLRLQRGERCWDGLLNSLLV